MSILIDSNGTAPSALSYVHKSLTGSGLKTLSCARRCALYKTDQGANLTGASLLFAESMYLND